MPCNEPPPLQHSKVDDHPLGDAPHHHDVRAAAHVTKESLQPVALAAVTTEQLEQAEDAVLCHVIGRTGGERQTKRSAKRETV